MGEHTGPPRNLQILFRTHRIIWKPGFIRKTHLATNPPSVSTPLRSRWKRSGRKLLKLHRSVSPPWTPCPVKSIDVEIPKLDVAGSSPVSRSIYFQSLTADSFLQQGSEVGRIPLVN